MAQGATYGGRTYRSTKIQKGTQKIAQFWKKCPKNPLKRHNFGTFFIRRVGIAGWFQICACPWHIYRGLGWYTENLKHTTITVIIAILRLME